MTTLPPSKVSFLLKVDQKLRELAEDTYSEAKENEEEYSLATSILQAAEKIKEYTVKNS